MNRRGFLASCLIASAAPAIVRAESLMKLWVPPQEIWVQPIGALQPMQSVWISGDGEVWIGGVSEILVYDSALSIEEQRKLIGWTRCSSF